MTENMKIAVTAINKFMFFSWNYEVVQHQWKTVHGDNRKEYVPRFLAEVNYYLPQQGDVIEFVNNNRLYRNAMVGDPITEHGVLHICEQASCHTDGEYFSTSGGTWTHIHQSHFEFVGNVFRRFWTWGANGAGGGQAIYFDMLVHKFRQIDMPKVTPEHRIYFGNPRYKEYGYKVTVMKDWQYIFKGFETIQQFKDWAKYVGLTYTRDEWGRYWSDQFIKTEFFWKMDTIPARSKPITMMWNATNVKGYVYKTGDTIIFYTPNPNAKEVWIPVHEKELAI